MGLLDRYKIIFNFKVDVIPVKTYENVKPKPVHILDDAHVVTIAEINPVAMGKVTAHRLKDYRRKTFSLMLLPDIQITLDELLKDVGKLEDYNEFKGT